MESSDPLCKICWYPSSAGICFVIGAVVVQRNIYTNRVCLKMVYTSKELLENELMDLGMPYLQTNPTYSQHTNARYLNINMAQK